MITLITSRPLSILHTGQGWVITQRSRLSHHTKVKVNVTLEACHHPPCPQPHSTLHTGQGQVITRTRSSYNVNVSRGYAAYIYIIYTSFLLNLSSKHIFFYMWPILKKKPGLSHWSSYYELQAKKWGTINYIVHLTARLQLTKTVLPELFQHCACAMHGHLCIWTPLSALCPCNARAQKPDFSIRFSGLNLCV